MAYSCTNPITTQFLNGTSTFSAGSPMSGTGMDSNALQQIEGLLASLFGGGGFPGMTGGGFPGMTGGGQYPFQNVGYPTNQGAGGFNAQGLRNIKLTTKAGPPLDLQEDMQGNLFNKDGKSVGVINQQNGAVTLNSSAKDEIGALRWGTGDFFNPFSGGHKPDSAGNVTFGSEVSVSAGDLTPQQNTPNQGPPQILPAPWSTRPMPLTYT